MTGTPATAGMASTTGSLANNREGWLQQQGRHLQAETPCNRRTPTRHGRLQQQGQLKQQGQLLQQGQLQQQGHQKK
jgi:hypothetical protein